MCAIVDWIARPEMTLTARPVARATAAGYAEPLPDEVAPRRLWRSLAALAVVRGATVDPIA